MEPKRRILVVCLVALGAIVLGAAVLLLVPPLRDAVPATPGSWARVIGWFGAFTLLGLLVWRLVRPRWLGATLGALPLVVFTIWARAPAFYDRTVNEDFPIATAASDGPSATTAAVPPTSTAITTVGTTAVTETTAHDPSAPAPTSTTATTAPLPTPPAAQTAAPTEPVLLGAGSLRGLAGHDATGHAALYRLPDGTHVLRFEDLDVERAPDLHVYLVPGADQTDPDGGVRLAKLKGNKGNQNYEIPSDVDIEDYDAVLIWCRKFSVEVAGTALT